MLCVLTAKGRDHSIIILKEKLGMMMDTQIETKTKKKHKKSNLKRLFNYFVSCSDSTKYKTNKNKEKGKHQRKNTENR